MKTLSTVLTLSICSFLVGGCMTTGDRRLPPPPPVGAEAALELLRQEPPPSCSRAKDLAEYLQFFGNTLETNQLLEIVGLLGNERICEDGRIELVRVLEDANARFTLPSLIESLDRVGAADSNLADELSSLIVNFSATYDEVFTFITKQVSSIHAPVRFGCVELLHTYFTPGKKPALADQIVSMLIDRARQDSDAAVAELACRSLGEFGLSLDTNRREEILDTLKTIGNDLGRKYEPTKRNRNMPTSSADKVRETANAFWVKIRRM